MKNLCPRCHASLCIGTSWFGFVTHSDGKCPNCGLPCFYYAGLVWIRAGKYTTPDLEDAEKLAKEEGAEWPEWPKKLT